MINERYAKKFCCENISKIENYDKAVVDTTQMWDCHHRMELIKTGAVVDSFKQDLIDWGIYYDRPADELIFLTRKEHMGLHRKGRPSAMKGKRHSEETKRKISEAHKGMKCGPAWNKGKKRPYSEEVIRRMSEAHKGQRKGQHWKLVDGKRVWY